MNEPSPIPAILDGVSTRKDRTLKVILETSEISTEQKVYLMENVNEMGYFYFHKVPFKNIVIPKISLNDFESKSPAQRLHNVIYRLWEKSDRSKDEESYYRYMMDKIIDQLKERLN